MIAVTEELKFLCSSILFYGDQRPEAKKNIAMDNFYSAAYGDKKLVPKCSQHFKCEVFIRKVFFLKSKEKKSQPRSKVPN